MADRSIPELPVNLELEAVNIEDLPEAVAIYSDSLMVMSFQHQAFKIRGEKVIIFAQEATKGLAEKASGFADAAEKSAQAAKKSEGAAGDSAKAAAKSADTAKQYSGKPPIIQDGTWWTWDAEKQVYVDTGEAAKGNVMYATFFVDPATGELYMVTDEEYTGPGFRLDENGNLEVVLTYG